MTRSIIHVNIVCFAASVEQCLDSRLRSRPVILAYAGVKGSRVYGMSYAAYQSGIRKGMPLSHALRCCRDAAVLSPSPDRYERAMRELVRRASSFSPRLETGEADGHLFLDVTGTGRLFGPPIDIARRLCREIHDRLCLNPVWSVAPNKLTAKTATRLVNPGSGYVVAAGTEADFMAPIPLERVPGLEKTDLERLRDFHFLTAGQVASLHLAELEVLFGTRAEFIRDTVRGIDPSPVRMLSEVPPVIRLEHLLLRHTNEAEPIEKVLYLLTEEAGTRLRTMRLACRRMVIHLEYADGIRVIRQAVVSPATSVDARLFEAARSAFYPAWLRRVHLRRIVLIYERLVPPPAQIPLFEGFPRIREEAKMAAIDAIRSRFGRNAIRIGRTMCPV